MKRNRIRGKSESLFIYLFSQRAPEVNFVRHIREPEAFSRYKQDGDAQTGKTGVC